MPTTPDATQPHPAPPVPPALPALPADAPPTLPARWRWLLCLLSAGALVVSAVLVLQAYLNVSLPGCSADGALDCDSVLATRWAKWFGLPVSLPAMGVYLAMLAALQAVSADAPRARRWAWRAMVSLSVAMLASAAWFTGLQVHLGQYCLYCLIAHALGVAMALLTLALAWRARRGASSSQTLPMMRWPVLAGLLMALALPAGQWLSSAATHDVRRTLGGMDDFDTGPQAGAERSMSVLRGRIRLRPNDHPYIGPRDARHVLVYLYDYTCPSCRILHRQFKDLMAKRPGDVGIVKLVTPMGHACNPHVKQTKAIHAHACELARLALAVWLADREQFPAYDDWLNQGDEPPTPQAAHDQAVELVGTNALSAALRDDDIASRIDSHLTVYGLTGGSVVPQFIMGATVVFSLPSPQQLEALFQTHLGPPPTPADVPAPPSTATPGSPLAKQSARRAGDVD